LKQTALLVLQAPARVGQLALLWHSAPLLLQFPSSGQSVSRKQPDATREQVPASVGHCGLLVQPKPLTLQAPVGGQSVAIVHAAPLVLLLLHVPGGHVVSSVQVPHSSVQRLQPGGFQLVVQVAGLGGTHTGTPILQTWGLTLLHVCPVMLLHVWGVTPLHVCGAGLSQVWTPMPTQLCGKVLQTCPTAPRHVWAL
jgi:hypothetical protein